MNGCFQNGVKKLKRILVDDILRIQTFYIDNLYKENFINGVAKNLEKK